MNKTKINNKIFCISILFILVVSTVFAALPIPASAATTKTIFNSNMTTLWTNTGVRISSSSQGVYSCVVDGVVYVGSNDLNVYALDASSGAKIWSYTTGFASSSSPCVVSGVVYIGGSGDKNLYALNASSGAKIWSYTTGGAVYSRPCVVDGVVYVGSYDKNVYALDASSGAKIWNYTVGNSIASSPCVVDGVLYIGSSDKNVYALDASSGAKIWNYTVGGYVTSIPCVVDGVVYFGSYDKNVYALDASSGAKIWNYTVGSNTGNTNPCVVDGVVYFGSSDKGAFALDASSGAKIWNFTVGGSSTTYSPCVVDGVVYFGSSNKNVYALKANTTSVTGQLLWSYNTGNPVYTNPCVADGVLYMGTNLAMYAFGPTTTSTTITTCDSTGNEKGTFNPAWNDGSYWHGGENVYFTAQGLNASTTYPIYVFIKNSSFTLGMAFPARFYNTATSITTDSAGNLAPTSIYGPITGGEYYVALDINSNGIYDTDDLIIKDLAVTLPLVYSNSSGGTTVLYLTPDDLRALPSYTGVGLPRRGGGYYPMQQLGNYTGIPLPALCNLVGGMTPGAVVRYATIVDGYSAAMSYEQAYLNQYTQFNITLGKQYEGTGDNPLTIMTGQSPLTMLAYGVNGTSIPSDASGGGDNDLGGPYRIYVVSNNGTSTSLANDGIAVFGSNLCKFVTSIYVMNAGSFSLNTTNNLGIAKTTFKTHENIYCSATGLNASTTYPIYVVPDQTTWPVRVPFPTRVSGSATTLTTDSSGSVVAASVYANAQPGQYAIIVDKNSNGKYDEADFLITNTTVTTDVVQCTLTMLTQGEGTVSPGNQTVPYGTTVDLNAYTSSGWGFYGWSGDASGTSNTTITIDDNKVVTATFKQQYTLTMYTTGQGTVSPGNQTYLSGTTVDLKAFTEQGWGFSCWSGGVTGYVNTTITMNGDMTVTAAFTQDTYILTMITAGQGTVSPGNQTYISGTSVDLKAFNAEGWGFAGWSGDASGTDNTTIIMTGNKAVTATFTENPSPSPSPSSSSPSATSSPSPAKTATPKPTPTPTPTLNPTNTTTIPVTTDTGTTVNLVITGNITGSQLSNVTIVTNQTAGTTVVSFTVTGQSGTTGYANITVPKSAVPYGTTPLVYIDGQLAENQSCTQDADNYYIYYTTHFSTHQVTIEFTGKVEMETSLWLVAAFVVAFFAIALVVSVAIRRGRKNRTK